MNILTRPMFHHTLAGMNSTPLETLTLAKFSELLHARFRVRVSPSEEIELELAEATPGRVVDSQGRGGERFESFSLVFHGPADRLLPQKMHLFEHPQLGRFELFMVPIGQGPGCFKYQVIFNRLIPAG
jgi:hypothetical protein